MRKGKILAALLAFLLPLASCGSSSSESSGLSASSSSSAQSTYTSYVTYAGAINDKSGTIHICTRQGVTVTGDGGRVSPFDTSISMTYFMDKGEASDTAFQDAFTYWMQHYHALFDRHSYYSEDGAVLNNVRIINDSYGSGQKIKLDEDLYGSLKRSYGFSLNSDGRFSIAVGNMSALWDYYLTGSLQYDEWAAPYAEASYNQQRAVFEDPNPTWFDIALKTTPTAAELRDMLTFDDSDDTVTFNSVPRIDNYVSQPDIASVIETLKTAGLDFSKPSLTLGGYGKGEATELFADRYPARRFLINSGSSSVKCNTPKPDSQPWNLSIASPYYNEAQRVTYYDNLGLNSADLILRRYGAFNLSTSGYYNQYFYVEQSDGSYVLRDHIFDPSTGYSHTHFASASVLMDDSGYADMYTTALMNTDSLTEAMSLISDLDNYTGLTAVPYFIVNAPRSDGSKAEICYADQSICGQFVDAHEAYPDSFPYSSITSVIGIPA